MYKKNQLQSTFIKIISSEKSNTIVFINFLIWFFKNFIRLLDNDLKEQKQIFLLKDFNINLLIYNEHQPTNKCLGSPSSKFYNFLCFTVTKKLLLTQKLLLITFFLIYFPVEQNVESQLPLYLIIYLNSCLPLIYSYLSFAKNQTSLKQWKLYFWLFL